MKKDNLLILQNFWEDNFNGEVPTDLDELRRDLLGKFSPEMFSEIFYDRATDIANELDTNEYDSYGVEQLKCLEKLIVLYKFLANGQFDTND